MLNLLSILLGLLSLVIVIPATIPLLGWANWLALPLIVLGVVAWILEANKFAVAPIILGIVLGPLVEQNFTTSMMIARGDPFAFFERPIAAVLGVVTLAIWAAVLVGVVLRRARRSAATELS